MRAKTVDFQRGLDPKDSLSLGNENLRKFRKSLAKKDFLVPWDNMIDLIEAGMITDEDAKEFIVGAIKEYAPKHIDWLPSFIETANIYWDKFDESLNISFSLPDSKKIQTWIGKISTAEGHIVFKMKTGAYSPDNKDYDIKESNIFYYNDELFGIKFFIRQTSRVIATIRINLD